MVIHLFVNKMIRRARGIERERERKGERERKRQESLECYHKYSVSKDDFFYEIKHAYTLTLVFAYKKIFYSVGQKEIRWAIIFPIGNNYHAAYHT